MTDIKITWYKPEDKMPEPCEALLIVLKCEEHFIFIGSYDPQIEGLYERNFVKHDDKFKNKFSQYEIKYWAYLPDIPM